MGSAPQKIIQPNTPDSAQYVPNYVITFIPFLYRELYYSGRTRDEALATDKPVVVVSDAISINIHGHKGSPVVEADIELASFNVNYASVIGVGDHVFINLLNNINDFNRISNNALAGRAINDASSGLKFVGRVVSVRQTLSVNPTTNAAQYRYHIHCAAFSELLTQTYYNEYLSAVNNQSPNPTLEFFASISKQYQDLYSKLDKNARLPTEQIVNFMLDLFIGRGLIDPASNAAPQLKATPNATFLIPAVVRQYLGLPLHKKPDAAGYQYSDILQRVFGIQHYSNSFFPDVKSRAGANYFQCGPLHGGIRPAAANFNGSPLWGVLQRFANPALNELYTAIRPSYNDTILPHIILRQIPMTTKYLKDKYTPNDATFFLNLPRWVLSSDYPIYQYNLGTSDVERFNFFLTYTDAAESSDPTVNLKVQINSGNWVFDQMNAMRNGVRVHTTFTNTDSIIQKDGRAQPAEVNKWAALIADFYLNGHLKMNGSIVVAGIQEPVWHGDNFVFDNKIFHIEGFSHNFHVDPGTGRKHWVTVLHVSHGYYLMTKDGQEKTVYVHETARTPSAQSEIHLPTRTGEELYVNDVINFSHQSGDQQADKNLIDRVKDELNKKLPKAASKILKRK